MEKLMPEQAALFPGRTGPEPNPGQIITSISYKQGEILRDIIWLYVPDGFECDVTYNRGSMYKRIPSPPLKFDIQPEVPGVVGADCRALPLRSASLGSLIFDPLFIAGSTNTGKVEKSSPDLTAGEFNRRE
jgi:hypothetical protein